MRTTLRPSHSLLLIGDFDLADPPEDMAGGLVAATNTCVAVGTRSASDGATRVKLQSSEEQPPTVPGLRLVHSSTLEVGGRVQVFTVDWDVVLEAQVDGAGPMTVEVLANDDREPDEIVVRIRGREAFGDLKEGAGPAVSLGSENSPPS